MEYKEFLIRLSETARKYAELPEDSEDVCGEENKEKITEKNIDLLIQFDGNGDYVYETSFYCPINIDAAAFISDASKEAVFNITVNTDYPQYAAFWNKKAGESVSYTIKTNIFSKTKMTIKVHCSMPLASAKLHLSYNIEK